MIPRRLVERLERWRNMLGQMRGKDPKDRAIRTQLLDDMLQVYLDEQREQTRYENEAKGASWK